MLKQKVKKLLGKAETNEHQEKKKKEKVNYGMRLVEKNIEFRFIKWTTNIWDKINDNDTDDD